MYIINRLTVITFSIHLKFGHTLLKRETQNIHKNSVDAVSMTHYQQIHQIS